MSDPEYVDFDPQLDLKLERMVDVSPELVWRAWTEPEHLKQWFAPAPWTVADAVVDLRPGGLFRTVMRDPEGTEYPGDGCILDVVPNARLVWTDALLPGYRPAAEAFFTACITMRPANGSTHYVAVAKHRNVEDRNRHDEMGFADGWGKCLDQLVELARGM